MAASSSMAAPSGRRSHAGESSVNKNSAPKAWITGHDSASNETISPPNKNRMIDAASRAAAARTRSPIGWDEERTALNDKAYWPSSTHLIDGCRGQHYITEIACELCAVSERPVKKFQSLRGVLGDRLRRMQERKSKAHNRPGVLSRNRGHRFRGFCPVYALQGRFKGMHVGRHDRALRIAQPDIGYLVLLGIGPLDITDCAFQTPNEGGDAVISFSPDARRPADGCAFANGLFPLRVGLR